MGTLSGPINNNKLADCSSLSISPYFLQP